MLKKFENFGGMDYILQTTKEVMYDLPEGYTYNAYVEDGRLDIEVMSDEDIRHNGMYNLHNGKNPFTGKTEEIKERIAYVIRLCEQEGMKPYIAIVLHFAKSNSSEMYYLDQKTIGFKPENDVETKLERIMSDKDMLISIRIAFSKPKRVSSFQDLPNGPESTQVQRVLNILKTLYPITETTAVWDEDISMKILRLFSGESSVNLYFNGMGEARARLLRDLEELDIEDLDASGASINKAIKLYLEPHYKNKKSI